MVEISMRDLMNSFSSISPSPLASRSSIQFLNLWSSNRWLSQEKISFISLRLIFPSLLESNKLKATFILSPEIIFFRSWEYVMNSLYSSTPLWFKSSFEKVSSATVFPTRGPQTMEYPQEISSKDRTPSPLVSSMLNTWLSFSFSSSVERQLVMKFSAAVAMLLRMHTSLKLLSVSFNTTMLSSFFRYLLIQSDFRASQALSLDSGFLMMSLEMKSFASGETPPQMSPWNPNLAFSIMAMVSYLLFPLKGNVAESITYRRTPKLHMSHFSSYYPMKMSGAAYSGVPQTLINLLFTNDPNPQSINLIVMIPSTSLIRMFQSLMSLCTIFRLCVYASAFRVWQDTSAALPYPKRPFSVIQVQRSRPSNSSVTMQKTLGSSQNSQILRILGWSRLLSTSISSR